MGFYSERVLPRMVDVLCGMKSAIPLRQQVCAGLHGQVVEIGFGSGLNVPYYPAVTGGAAIEPADRDWRLAGKRLDGQSLPSPDDSCDTAVSTWTLCTIPDVEAALAEVRLEAPGHVPFH